MCCIAEWANVVTRWEGLNEKGAQVSSGQSDMPILFSGRPDDPTELVSSLRISEKGSSAEVRGGKKLSKEQGTELLNKCNEQFTGRD